MNADTIPAGRELDALVAEKVMGCGPIVDGLTAWNAVNAAASFGLVGQTGPEPRINPNHPYEQRGQWSFLAIPHYSTDIAAAWEVVEKMGPGFRLVKVTWADQGEYGSPSTWGERLSVRNGWWGCGDEEGALLTFADTAPLAICRAALKAVGVE